MRDRIYIYRSHWLFLILALTCSFSIYGQVKVFESHDNYAADKFISYQQIRKDDLTNNFIAKDQNSNKVKIPRSSIWGYQDADGILYRVWEDLPLKVDFSNNRMIIYLTKKDDTILLDDLIIPDSKSIVYFSKTLSDQIYKMDLEKLLSKLDFNAEVKQKLPELDKKFKLTKKNSITKKYFLVETIFEK